jgi:exosortase
MRGGSAVAPANEAGPVPAGQREISSKWAACVCLLLAVLVFAPTLYWLWQRWTMDVWHNVHGLLIPFVAAFFIYKVLRSDSVPDAEHSAWGFLFVIAGLGMIVMDSAIRTQLLSAFGMVVCLPGISLLLLGSRRTRALAFVWVLFLFMLPIPAAFLEAFILVLRRITATGVEHVLVLFGTPVIREDTKLVLPSVNMFISDGCSGFSVLYASVTLALIFAYISSSWPRRLATLAVAFPIAVGCNILRCTLLAAMAQHWGGGVLDTSLHPISGMLTFAAAVALLSWIGTDMPRRAT